MVTFVDLDFQPDSIRALRRILGEDQSRQLALFDGVDDGVFTLDPEGRFTFVNRFVATNSGYPAEAFLGRHFLELIRPEDQKLVQNNFAASLAGQVVPAYELAYRTKAGDLMWVEIKTAPLVHSGQTIGLFCITRNIQKRKSMELALRQNEEKYRTLVEALPVGVLILQGSQIVFANQAVARLFQLDDPVKQLSERMLDFVAPSERQRLSGMLQRRQAGRTDAPIRTTTVLRRADGSDFPAELHAHQLQFQGQAALQYLVVDTSERQTLEDQLRQVEKLDALGTLAGGIAHDFNNLLTGILGMASLLEATHPAGGSVHEKAVFIGQTAQRAAELAGQLLSFARKDELHLGPVDVHATIASVTDLLKRTIDQRIEIFEKLDAACSLVHGDAGQLQQLVMNLAVNAAQAMRQTGRLTIETRTVRSVDPDLLRSFDIPAAEYLELRFSDTGPGVPAGLEERIFEPFFTTKDTGEGTGLGLAVAYGVVKNHAGAIRLEPGEGPGATFQVFLPTARDVQEQPSPAELPMPAGSGLILVVDDEEAVLMVATRILQMQGYRVLTAVDGLEALEIYARCGYEIDLVLLDLSMPRMNGRDCLQELRRREPEIKVLLSSGNNPDDETQALFVAGLTGFLRKPYLPRQLAAAVADLLV